MKTQAEKPFIHQVSVAIARAHEAFQAAITEEMGYSFNLEERVKPPAVTELFPETPTPAKEFDAKGEFAKLRKMLGVEPRHDIAGIHRRYLADELGKIGAMLAGMDSRFSDMAARLQELAKRVRHGGVLDDSDLPF